MREIVSFHPVLAFEMSDDGLYGGPPSHLAFDLWCHAPLLAGDEDPELVIGRRIVAAVSLVGDEALKGIADERLRFGNDSCQRMAVVRLSSLLSVVLYDQPHNKRTEKQMQRAAPKPKRKPGEGGRRASLKRTRVRAPLCSGVVIGWGCSRLFSMGRTRRLPVSCFDPGSGRCFSQQAGMPSEQLCAHGHRRLMPIEDMGPHRARELPPIL
jgi:hypothetical protein